MFRGEGRCGCLRGLCGEERAGVKFENDPEVRYGGVDREVRCSQRQAWP